MDERAISCKWPTGHQKVRDTVFVPLYAQIVSTSTQIQKRKHLTKAGLKKWNEEEKINISLLSKHPRVEQLMAGHQEAEEKVRHFYG